MMMLIFKKTFDGHEVGKAYEVERSLAARFIEVDIAEPLTKHLERIEAAKAAFSIGAAEDPAPAMAETADAPRKPSRRKKAE